MPSKIVFLGVSGDSFTTGRQMLGTGGIIIQSNDLQFHIDPGPGSLIRAKQFDINVRENSVVIVTHNHVNHANDLNAIIDAMTYSGLDKKGVVLANSTVINGTDKDPPVLSNFHRNCVERVLTLTPGKKVGIEEVEIHALHAKHTDPNTIGLKIYTNDFVLAYTSDTKYSAEAVEGYKGCDILVLNVVNPSTEKSDYNLNSDDAVKIISKVKPRLAIITHFGIKMLKADPLQEARDIQRQTGIQVIAAKDGLSLSPTSYAAQSRQKTLLNLKKQEVKEEVVEEEKETPTININTEQLLEESAEDKNVEEHLEQTEKKEEQKPLGNFSESNLESYDDDEESGTYFDEQEKINSQESNY